MNKKGAPASMLKHEKAEMKGMKAGGKVRRMAGGGAAGYLDSLENEDYEKQKEQGAKNWKSLKNFFGFGEQAPAPIEERKFSSSAPTASGSVEKLNWSGSGDSDVIKTSKPEKTVAQQMKDREKGGPNERANYGADGRSSSKYFSPFAYGPDYLADGKEGVNSFTSTGNAKKAEEYRQSLMAENNPSMMKRKKPVTVSETKETKSVTASPSDSSYDAVEKNRAAKSQSATLARLRKESEDKIRDSRPGSMTKQMREAPTIDELYKGQKSMSDEIGNALKSFRSSIRGGLKAGENKRKMREEEQHIAKGGKVKAYAQGGNVKKMAMGGVGMKQPMPVAPKVDTRPIVNGRRIPLLDTNRPGLSELAKQKMNTYNQGMLNRANNKPASPPPMANQQANPQANPYQTEVPQNMADGYMKGGKVKKMAEGGFTREADGVAKKGKTQGKMVKMAGGGFVRSADGCAQRGKTRGAQVKMSRGGKC